MRRVRMIAVPGSLMSRAKAVGQCERQTQSLIVRQCHETQHAIDITDTRVRAIQHGGERGGSPSTANT